MLRSALPVAALLGGVSAAQVVVDPPNYSVDLVATNIQASGESMAVDRFGNAYIVDATDLGDRITQVSPDGDVDPNHALVAGTLGQLAYHPLEGVVYAVETHPILPVIHSDIYRINPNGGASKVFGAAVVATGLTIDNDGTFYFGGMGLDGPGLYRLPNPTGVTSNPVRVSAGFGANAMIQALVTGDVLIADGDKVERWSPGSFGTIPYYDAPGPNPNELVEIVGLARGPMNQLGSGALLGVYDLSTFCICGEGRAISTGPTGDVIGISSALFASEDFTHPETGLVTIAAGVRQSAYWLTRTGPAGGITPDIPARLFRIDQQPGPHSQGSLFVAATATTVTFDLYGPAGGGDPFILGASLALPTTPPFFLPPWGYVDLLPGLPGYLTLLDGIGLGGPANPFAIFPNGGHYHVVFPVPPGLTGLTFRAQDLILAPQEAPNGFFFVSNLAEFQIL